MSQRSSESYGQYGVSWVDRLGQWLSRRAVRRRLPEGDRLVVLELGCGYRATHLMDLRGRVARATGIDFAVAPELRDTAGYTFHEGPIEHMVSRVESGSCDVVLALSVLEHLADPQAVLASAAGLLKPGGILLVNVPTWRGKVFLELSAFRLGLSPRVEMDDHKMYYDKRDLWPMLVRAGFRPSAIAMNYHKFGLNLIASARRSEDA